MGMAAVGLPRVPDHGNRRRLVDDAGRDRRECPIIDTSNVLGGLWADREGYIDCSAVVHAYAKAARQRGADVIEHNRVLDLEPRTDGGGT